MPRKKPKPAPAAGPRVAAPRGRDAATTRSVVLGESPLADVVREALADRQRDPRTDVGERWVRVVVATPRPAAPGPRRDAWDEAGGYVGGELLLVDHAGDHGLAVVRFPRRAPWMPRSAGGGNRPPVYVGAAVVATEPTPESPTPRGDVVVP